MNWTWTGDPATETPRPIKRCRRYECGLRVSWWRAYCCRGCKRTSTSGYDATPVPVGHTGGCYDRAGL